MIGAPQVLKAVFAALLCLLVVLASSCSPAEMTMRKFAGVKPFVPAPKADWKSALRSADFQSALRVLTPMPAARRGSALTLGRAEASGALSWGEITTKRCRRARGERPSPGGVALLASAAAELCSPLQIEN